MRVDDRLAKVVRSDPATKALLTEFASAYQRFEDLQRAVDAVRLDMIADEDKHLIQMTGVATPLAEAWRAAIVELTSRPEAALPSSSSL